MNRTTWRPGWRASSARRPSMPVSLYGPAIERTVSTIADSGQYSADVAVLSDGTYVIVWESHVSGKGIVAQRFDTLDQPIGMPFDVNSTDLGSEESASVTALADGGFVVAWEAFAQDG